MENKELEDQTDENADNEEESAPRLTSEEKKKSTKWRCPECKQTTTFYIAMSAAPACSNPKAHPNKVFKMEPV